MWKKEDVNSLASVSNLSQVVKYLEVRVSNPQGFVAKGEENKVYKLKKALYGLKQAPRAWNRKIDSFQSQIGFKKCTSEHGVYVRCLQDSKS